MTNQETGDYVVKEIGKLLERVRSAKSGTYDAFAKAKVRALVDVLDLLAEVKTEAELVSRVQQLYRARTGALDGLRDLLQAMGVRTWRTRARGVDTGWLL
ncbi:hypothetical protein [Myxococcus stipitatus]|uniref:hypothetical protein n=1 Tax=Myxococcus stipitatus TaxID=83455 RepID=UPI0030D3244C